MLDSSNSPRFSEEFTDYLSHLDHDPFFHPVLAAFGGMKGESTTIIHEQFIRHFVDRLMLTRSHLDEDTCDAISGYNDRAWWNFLPRGNAFLQDLSSSKSTMQQLTTLAIPTLLLHGKQDALVPLSLQAATR